MSMAFYLVGCGIFARGRRFALFAVGSLLSVGVAFGDIRDTKHMLLKESVTSDGSDICIFCHTPDLSKSAGAISRAPGWQRSTETSHVFTIYDDIGRLGLGKSSVGSQSIACLSCHDAVQAFSASKSSEDHPFGVPYRGAVKGQAGRGGSVGGVKPKEGDRFAPYRQAEHLKALDDFKDVNEGVVENRKVWWVSSSGVSARRSRSDLPLYSRLDFESGEEAIPHIECSSCHDPHSSTNKTFLRISNDGSKLCLTCHDK